jgi:hypothetical protein
MRHTLCFRSGDDGRVLLEAPTIAYGVASRYELCATELGVGDGSQVRVELLDHNGLMIGWRTYTVSQTCGQLASLVPNLAPCLAPIGHDTDRHELHPRPCRDQRGQPQHRLDLPAPTAVDAPFAGPAVLSGQTRCAYRWR